MIRRALVAMMLLLNFLPSCINSPSAFATLASNNNKNIYTGNGLTRVWSYTFPIIAASDVKVYKIDSSGVQTEITSNFSINTTSSEITYPTIASGLPLLDSNMQIILLRVEPLTQSIHLTNQGAFNAAVLEQGYDKLTMIAQQHDEVLKRVLAQPLTVNTQVIFPAPSSNKVIGWNEAGDGLENKLALNTNDVAAAAASASAASSSASSASSSAAAAAASAATFNWAAPSIGVGTVTPVAGKFTTLEATSTFKVGTTHQGDIFYDNGTSIVRLTPGTAGQLLKTNGGSANPSWTDPVPQGVIVMWSGTIATIPSGWELSDGSCAITCPNLTNKFIVGADADSGGAAKTTYTGSATQSGGSLHHTHTYSGTTDGAPSQGSNYSGADNPVSTPGHTHTYSGTTANESAVPVVYYSLAFIIKD